MTDYTWPDDLQPYAVEFYLQPYTGGTQSPFNRKTKVYGISAPQWVCRLRFRGADSADRWGGPKNDWGERLDAFLAKVEGRTNRIVLWDFRRPGRPPLFSNAAVTAGANSITLTGASTTEIRIGEYIGGDGRPHIITDLDVSGSNMIATVKPAFQADIAVGAATFEKVSGYFRLTSDDAGQNGSSVGDLADYSLDLIEDFGPPVGITYGGVEVTYSL
jgi:hypothetical protein